MRKPSTFEFFSEKVCVPFATAEQQQTAFCSTKHGGFFSKIAFIVLPFYNI